MSMVGRPPSPGAKALTSHKEEIERLYKKHTLKEVLNFIQSKYDFKASVHVWKRLLKKWGFTNKNKKSVGKAASKPSSSATRGLLLSPDNTPPVTSVSPQPPDSAYQFDRSSRLQANVNFDCQAIAYLEPNLIPPEYPAPTQNNYQPYSQDVTHSVVLSSSSLVLQFDSNNFLDLAPDTSFSALFREEIDQASSYQENNQALSAFNASPESWPGANEYTQCPFYAEMAQQMGAADFSQYGPPQEDLEDGDLGDAS